MKSEHEFIMWLDGFLTAINNREYIERDDIDINKIRKSLDKVLSLPKEEHPWSEILKRLEEFKNEKVPERLPYIPQPIPYCPEQPIITPKPYWETSPFCKDQDRCTIPQSTVVETPKSIC